MCTAILQTSCRYLRMRYQTLLCQLLSTSVLQEQGLWLPSFLNWFKQGTFSFIGITVVFGKSLSPLHATPSTHAERQLSTITELWQTQNRPDDMLRAHKLQALSTPILTRPGRKNQEKSTYAKSFSRNIRNDVTNHAISAHVSAGTAFRLCDGLRGGMGNSRHSEPGRLSS